MDLSGLPLLRKVALDGQTGITGLDLRGNTALASIRMHHTGISDLNLSENPALRSLLASHSALARVRVGNNELAQLAAVDLDSCRLPLSQLASFRDRPGLDINCGVQWDVFFERKRFRRTDEAVLDFSTEAVIDGIGTDFAVTDEYGKSPVSGDCYSVQGGNLQFTRPGRYRVLMSNEAVRLTVDDGAMVTTRVFTGVIEVDG